MATTHEETRSQAEVNPQDEIEEEIEDGIRDIDEDKDVTRRTQGVEGAYKKLNEQTKGK